MLTRTEELPSVARRIAAGQMLMEGATVKSVADSLHLSAQMVRRYKLIVEAGRQPIRLEITGAPEAKAVIADFFGS